MKVAAAVNAAAVSGLSSAQASMPLVAAMMQSTASSRLRRVRCLAFWSAKFTIVEPSDAIAASGCRKRPQPFRGGARGMAVAKFSELLIIPVPIIWRMRN